MVTLSLSETLASMSDDDIMALVGPATWANGLRLEHAGAVRELSWNQDGNLLEARVKEAGLTYRAWISQGAIRPSLKCACALRTDCPHAAAALIAGRAEALKRQESVPEWSRVLKQVLGGIRERSGEPLALVIDAHDPAVEAALIPLRRGSSFAWTTKRASWLDLTATQWASVTDGLDPTHVSLLREGYRLSRESRSWHSRTEVTLSSLEEHAYAWLERLVRAGVELFVSEDGRESFVLSHATWDADIDVVASEAGLEVRVVARNGDQVLASPRIDREAGLLLLDGGTRAARIEGVDALEGFPLDRPLVVPASDVAEFRASWLPSLRRRFVMSSSNGSFDPDARPQMRVVGTVRRDGGGVVVRWWVEYDEGESRSRVPLAQALGDEAVAGLVGRINGWGAALGSDLWPTLPTVGRLDPWRVPEFLSACVEGETVDGLVWDVAPDVRAIEVSQDGMGVELAVDGATSDWFDLNVRLRVGDHYLSVREALEAIGRGNEYVEVEGVWVRLDGPRIRALHALLDEARALTGWEGGGVRRAAGGGGGGGTGGGGGGCRWSSLGDNRDDRADLDGLVLGHADFREETCDGSRDLGIHLVGGNLKQRLVGIDGVAHGLQPRGDGALGDGLAQSGHAHLGALSGRGGRSSRSSCHGSRRSRSCRSSNGGGGRSSSGGRGLGRVANARDLGADFDGLILGNQDLEEDAGDGGRDLGVDLVGGHLNDGLIELDGIADLLEPRRNGALGDGLAQSGHSH